MDRFVCVRLVQANAMDLTLFQFDYDLTFAVLLMNADRTIYGRYGTRSSLHDAEKDISLAGFAAALSKALELHQGYPVDKADLAGKQPRTTKFDSPDEFPSLRGRYQSALDYEGKVVSSCMHCHQIRDAERMVYRSAGDPIPEPLLFPYPAPDVVGLTLSPDACAEVVAVTEGSPAAASGLEPGDQILSFDGQPMLSIADVQWVLHNAGGSALLPLTVSRNGRQHDLTLGLAEGWRRASDISWRVSTWPLRRMGTGGLVLESLSEADRRAANLDEASLALRVKHVGQYGAHAVAKQAGFEKDDIVVAFDQKAEQMSESELLAYAVQTTKPDQQVPVTVLRDGKRIDLTLRMQE